MGLKDADEVERAIRWRRWSFVAGSIITSSKVQSMLSVPMEGKKVPG